MQQHISKDLTALSHSAATWMVKYIDSVLKKSDRFTIVLSGGSTPKKLHELLASDEFRNKIEWEKLHFFWGDERVVPFEDERNNAKMAFDTLLNKVPVKKENIHIMQTDIEPHTACLHYEKILRSYFENSIQSFDLVLLGLGDDAHVLSLFPGYELMHEKKHWVKSFYLDAQKMSRITLTSPIINSAARVAFLVSGAGKAVALRNVLYGEHEPDLFPAQVIQPYNGELHWFIDEAAATEL